MVLRFDAANQAPALWWLPTNIGSGSVADTTTTLNSALVFGTSGGGVALRIVAARASSVKKVYLFLNSVGGTFANVQITGEIRNERTSGTNQQYWPGTTVRQSAVVGTIAGGAVKHWVEFDFSSNLYTPAIGEVLFFVCYNTSTNKATDYPSILTTTGYLPAALQGSHEYTLLTSTNGFTTAGTVAQNLAVCVVEYADGTIEGTPWTSSVATPWTNNQLERGTVIDGLDVPMYCSGFRFVGASSFNALKVFDGGTAPTGTPYQNFALGSVANQNNDKFGIKRVTPFLLNASTKYRFVITTSANSQLPGMLKIEGLSDFTDIGLVGGLGYGTQSNGTSWVDDKSLYGGIQPILSYFPPGSNTYLPVKGGSVT